MINSCLLHLVVLLYFAYFLLILILLSFRFTFIIEPLVFTLLNITLLLFISLIIIKLAFAKSTYLLFTLTTPFFSPIVLSTTIKPALPYPYSPINFLQEV